MPNKYKLLSSGLFLLLLYLYPTPASAAPSITLRTTAPSSVKVYEKYEVQFNVSTVATYPFFQYDPAPPAGVTPGVGITVEGVVTLPSGVQVRHPAFFTTETIRSGTGSNIAFTETANKYWVFRFAPQTAGNHSLSIQATDSSGTITYPVGSFSAATPSKPGFVRVSSADKRYFQYQNGQIFWPLGPVYWDDDFARFRNTNTPYPGSMLSRQWMAGQGAYSGNFARWKSSSEVQGNEGASTLVDFLSTSQRYPGSDGLAYLLRYPDAHRYWLTVWEDSRNFTPIKPNTTYQVKLVAKTSGITGPRVSGYPYGLVVKFYEPIYGDPSNEAVETATRNAPKPFSHITNTNNSWQTFQTTFTTPSSVGSDIWVMLDNVTAGTAHIYELSIKANGAEVVRNPIADIHTYVDSRPAAFFDWQLDQGATNGVYMIYVLHDKNDPIFNSLKTDGSWGGWFAGDGYNQPYNSKSSWLKRQWYRYAVARWSYSTNVFSFEAVNEADPNDSNHWNNVQENLARFTKSISAHPHFTVTSFWCCSFKDAFNFYSNANNLYPDIDYVDLHQYSGNSNTVSGNYTGDIAEWVKAIGEVALTKNAGKPLVWAELGLNEFNDPNGILSDSRVTGANSGIWYHNLLWSQLSRGAAFPIGYWFHTEHMNKISNGWEQIYKPFYTYISTTGFHLGGYQDISASTTNASIRIYGQKKSDGTRAYFWVQNSNSEWNKTPTAQSATLTFTLKPNTTFTVERWDTFTGTVSQTISQTSNSSGQLAISVNSLTKDTAFKIFSGAPDASPSINPTPNYKPGDANGDGLVNKADLIIWIGNYAKLLSGTSNADFNNNGKVNILDFGIWFANFGK